MSSARTLRSALRVGVLGVVVVATGGVVTAVVAGNDTDPASGAASSVATKHSPVATVSADVPLLNPSLDPADVVHVSPASRGAERTSLVDGEPVTFSLTVDGATREIATRAATLGDALAEADVVLGWEDVVSGDLGAAPESGAQVSVARGATEYLTEDVVTPAPREERPSDSLALGETRVVQEGRDGRASATVAVHRVDGEEVARETLVQVELSAAVTEIVEIGTRETPTSAKLYTLREFMSAGVVNWGGYRFTYYSQQVLPGGGLSIPGRHVNADGYVSDGDGYIVLANSSPKGTIIDTPFGYQGKVYDRGTHGNHYDVYTQ